jgi:tetratricopeptide (TPR) repeat protein
LWQCKQVEESGSLNIVIIKKVPNKKRVFFLFLVFSGFSSTGVIAAPLEDISLSAETDRVVATIRLSGPVANVRYSPTKKGTTLSILLDKLPDGLATEEWRDDEVLKSPPSNLIPSFTVKTNLRNIQPRLIIDFSREAEYTVQMGRDGRSIVVGIKIDKKMPKFEGNLPFLPEVQPLPATATEINKQASVLFQKGRNALAASDSFAAIDAFNKLLLLPPNDYTQDGQEWVGVARERAGQLDKAKVEYELYLKLYSNAEDAKRVKTRLATLGSKPLTSPSLTAESVAVKKKTLQTLSYGSLSMHYYHGASKIDTVDTASPFGNSLSQSTFSAVDQSAILTSVVATERFISEEYDNRIVFQDTAYSNFLPGQSGKNRLGAAYFELKNRMSDYSVRLGRQSSSGGGVMGRFDGATAGVGVTPSLRLNAVAGQLSDFTIGSKPVFYGASMDMGPVTIYAINQTVDDVLERRAVGTEIRYFDPTKSAFALLDYDTSFAALNVAMLQGTLSATPERTYNMLLDHRRTPYLSIRNALNGALTTSLADLMQFMTEEEIRALAAARTGTSNLAQLGVLQQLSPKWQIGGDVRVSRYESLPASGLGIVDPNVPEGVSPTLTGLLPETPGSGNEWAISPQLIGSNLYSSRDVTVLSLSYISSPLYKGQSFYVYNRGNLTDKWSLDLSLQLYRQNYDTGMLMTRILPTLRTAYQIRQSLSFDMDMGVEMSHTEIGTQTSDGQRQFFSLGFRFDF